MVHKSLINQLIEHEGKKYKPYRCTAGKLTIGVGRNLEDVGLSDDEIEYILKNDIKRTITELSKYSWYDDLSQTRQDALIDMHFNLGQTRFSKFRNMISALDNRDYQKVALEMLDSKWAQQVGQRAKTLSEMMRNG